jgi:hypothetical protein
MARAATVSALHINLISRLATNKPHEIRYSADARDLEERAEHVQAIGNAVLAYLTELVADTAWNAHGIDRDVCRGLSDDISDIVGNFTNAAENLRGIAA